LPSSKHIRLLLLGATDLIAAAPRILKRILALVGKKLQPPGIRRHQWTVDTI
jgi:hypothetical protein